MQPARLISLRDVTDDHDHASDRYSSMNSKVHPHRAFLLVSFCMLKCPDQLIKIRSGLTISVREQANIASGFCLAFRAVVPPRLFELVALIAAAALGAVPRSRRPNCTERSTGLGACRPIQSALACAGLVFDLFRAIRPITILQPRLPTHRE
jgi:hypothetical protein